MILGSGLLQSTGPSFGTLAADSSDSALLAGQDALVCVYDGAAYIYFGKASGTWKTLWVDTTGALLRGDEVGTYAVTLASDGPAPFDAAYGFSTDREAGSVAASTAFSHQKDMVLQFTQDVIPSAGYTRVRFRRVDADNNWEWLVSSDGARYLRETVDGGQIARGFTGGGLVGGESITIIADGISISIFSNVTLDISYGSASNFATATAGIVYALVGGSAISNLVTWPRYASTVASVLNKVSA